MKRILLLCVVGTLLSTCAESKRTVLREGAVFVAQSLVQDRDLSYDAVYPIVALRIESISPDSVSFSYRVGKEMVMRATFTYVAEAQVFRSGDRLVVHPPSGKALDASLRAVSPEEIQLILAQADSEETYVFRHTYTAEIDQDQVGNVYYAEDGFPLFEDDR